MTEPAPTAPISSEIKATNFTPQQVIEFGQESPSDQLIVSLHGIKQKDQDSEGAKKGFERLKVGNKEISLSQVDIEKIANLEGVEKAVREAYHDEIRNVDIFLEVAERSLREGVDESVVLAEIKKSGKWSEVPSLSEISRVALKALRETPETRTFIGNGNEDAVNEAIVKSILSNPDDIRELRQIYARAQKDVIARIDSLKPLKEVEGLKEEKKKRDRYKETYENLKTRLGSTLDIDESEIDDILKPYASGEMSEESFLQEVLERKLQKENILQSEQAQIADIVEAREQVNNLTKKISRLQSDKRKLDPDDENYQDSLESLKEEIEDLNERLEPYKTKAKCSADLEKKVNLYKLLKTQIIGTKSQEGGTQSIYSTRVKELIKNYSEYIKAEDKIESLEQADKDYQKQLTQRKFEEEDIARSIRTSLNDSLGDFFIKRIDNMTEFDKKRLAKEQDEKLKKFDKDSGKRYIEFDGKQEKHYRTKIREDIDAILKNGKEDGELIIVARILDIKDASGTSISDDMTKWTDEQKAEVKRIHEQRAGEIRKNLFSSYYKSKLCGERSWIKIGKPFSKDILFEGTAGSLALTDAQFSHLAEQYSSEMETAINSSKQAQQMIKGLKEKGINPNLNLKWLLWILIILGVIGGIAIFKH